MIPLISLKMSSLNVQRSSGFIVLFLLCLFIQFSNCVENSKNEENGLSQDIFDAVSTSLEDSPQELMSVLAFLFFEEHSTRHLQNLRFVMGSNQAFRGVLKILAKDAKKYIAKPEFQRVMKDIWNEFLLPSEKMDFKDGQYIDYRLPFNTSNNFEIKNTFNFVHALSTLPQSFLDEMIQLTADVDNYLFALPLAKQFNSALEFSKKMKGKEGALTAVFLTYQVYESIQKWQKNEISGVRCAKNIIENSVGLLAGVGGGMAGAAIGTAISPGLGTAIGAFLCGVAGQAAGEKFSDWVTQKIFNLPKEEALENAYRFLGVSYGASNDEINSNFRRLALEYHPDKGGSYENWHKLQVSMSLIKISKEDDSFYNPFKKLSEVIQRFIKF